MSNIFDDTPDFEDDGAFSMGGGTGSEQMSGRAEAEAIAWIFGITIGISVAIAMAKVAWPFVVGA